MLEGSWEQCSALGWFGSASSSGKGQHGAGLHWQGVFSAELTLVQGAAGILPEEAVPDSGTPADKIESEEGGQGCCWSAQTNRASSLKGGDWLGHHSPVGSKEPRLVADAFGQKALDWQVLVCSSRDTP